MTEINADNLPGKVMAPAAAYLTDQYTNRDIFGVVRGKCTECKDCGEYWKATADYTVSAGDTGVRKHPDNDISIINCNRCGCPPHAHVVLIAQQEQEAGNDAFALENFTAALGHYSRALQEQPHNAVLLSNRAACYLAMKWYPQAKRDAETAVSLRPDWAKAHARLGAAYSGMGHLDRAVASYTSCVKLSPDETQYVSALRDVQAAEKKAAAKAKAEKENRTHAPSAARSARSQSVGSRPALVPEKPQAGALHNGQSQGGSSKKLTFEEWFAERSNAASGKVTEISPSTAAKGPVPGHPEMNGGAMPKLKTAQEELPSGSPQVAISGKQTFEEWLAARSSAESGHVTEFRDGIAVNGHADNLVQANGTDPHGAAQAPQAATHTNGFKDTSSEHCSSVTTGQHAAAVHSAAMNGHQNSFPGSSTTAAGRSAAAATGQSEQDYLLQSMISDSCTPHKSSATQTGSDKAGNAVRASSNGPAQAATGNSNNMTGSSQAGGTPSETATLRHMQYLEALIGKMQQDHNEKERVLQNQMGSLEADVSDLRADMAHLSAQYHSLKASKGKQNIGPNNDSSPLSRASSSATPEPAAEDRPAWEADSGSEDQYTGLTPEEQERLGRVKAAEQRRVETEQTGEILHQTSCDSITQVQRLDCTSCTECPGFQICFRACDANDPEVMLHCSACGCSAHLHAVDMVWQEAEEARKSKEEAARRWRNRTASFLGAEAKDAFAEAARALRVDASADERQIRKAWKKAALETHPDKTGTSEPFIQITNAYLTLMGTS